MNIDNGWVAALAGAACGMVNGWASRSALKRVMQRSDKVFYGAYALGFFWRLIFLLASVWFMRGKKYIILLPFVGALVLTQFIYEIVPLGRFDGGPRKE